MIDPRMKALALLRDVEEKAKAATPGRRYATTGERHPSDQELEDTWTISTDPEKEGWENDGNYPGYGLWENDARFHARLDPPTALKMKKALDRAIEALEMVTSRNTFDVGRVELALKEVFELLAEGEG